MAMSLSNKEFKALARYKNGRLVDLPGVAYLLNTMQVEELHEDDWSYYGELAEESHSLMKENAEYFLNKA